MKIKYQCLNCGKESYYEKAQKKHYPNRGKYCSRDCGYQYHRKNPSQHRYVKPEGYVCIGDKYEHRLVMEKKLGRKLLRSEHVHHINGVKGDNRLENLIIIKEAEHHKLHGSRKHNYKCEICGRAFYVKTRRLGKHLYCSSQCYGVGRRKGYYAKVV